MRRSFASTIVGLLVAAGHCAATDFAKIDRRIAREPAYKETPLYCLAVIGPEATTRVWMVLDGEKLYVDKNCNGDLTDDGPPVELKDKKTDPSGFEIVKVSPDGGKTVYKFDVVLWSRPSFREPPDTDHGPFNQSVHVRFPDGRYFGAWGDQHQPLIFAAKAHDAPILHYDGPLRMGFEVRNPLRKSDDKYELNCCVGTPGSCNGAWVHLLYETIPEQFHPRAALEFPPEKPGGPPVKVDFTICHRC
jgi:hypothetical protein